FAQQIHAEKNGRPAKAASATIATKALVRLRHLICVALVGLVVVLLMPRASTAWADLIRTRPLPTFFAGLVGLAVFCLFLFVAIFAIILGTIILAGVRLSELAPLVAIGGTVGYAAVFVGFWIVFAFLAEALAGLALGRMFFRENNVGVRMCALLLGAVL